MKNIILFVLLFVGTQTMAQKIESIRVDSLQYNFYIQGIPGVKYEWIFTTPPDYNDQYIITKKDTTYFHFRSVGSVAVMVRYKDKEGKWSDNLFTNIKVK
jgi:hypothetical protein